MYPERPVRRSRERAIGEADTAAPGASPDAAAGGIRIATFGPRRAGVVEVARASADVRTPGQVLAALGMRGLATGGAIGAVAPRTTPGWVPEGWRIAITESVMTRPERRGLAPWVFAGTGEPTFLALPGMVPSDAGTPPEGLATSGPPLDRPTTTTRVGDPLSARFATGLSGPGPYGTTPLARLMALGTARAGRGRTEGTDLLGATEAGDWMLDGLLRLGLRGDAARPEAPAIAGRGSAAASPGSAFSPPAVLTTRPGAANSSSPILSSTRRGSTAAGSRRLREPAALAEAGAKGRRGRHQFAAAERYGETLVSRTLASREVSGPGTAGAASRPTSAALAVARAEGATPWGFGGDVDEVFLRFPWAERMEDVDRAVVWTVTRAAGAAGRPGSPGSVAETPRGRHAGSRPVRARPVMARPGAANAGSRRLREVVSGSGAPRDVMPWSGPTTVAGDEAALLVMARPPEREAEGREAAGWAGSRAGAIPAGAMWFIQRTLGRALRALPPEAWGEAGPRGEAGSGLVPADLAGLLGIVPAVTRGARAETAEAGRPWERAGATAGDLVAPPGVSATAGEPARIVRPERVEARTPGLPEESVILEMSLWDTGPAGPVVGPGTAPSLGGLIRTGETPGPALRGLPLVAPAVSAVATQAMMSRRSEGPTARPTRTPDAQAPAAGSEAAGSQPIDLDVLAIEMAERILRRMKRDKERRGHHD